MDLEVLIARVAVLRTESRSAQMVQAEATAARTEADERLYEADQALKAEIARRIKALDPEDKQGD